MPPGLMKQRLLSLLMLLSVCSCSMDRYVNIQGFAQGGTYSIKCSLPSTVLSQEVKDAVDSVLLRIDNSISGYNKGSILSRVNNGEQVALDDIFVDIFNISKDIWLKSGGAFDPSAGPLFDLWGFGFADSTATAAQKALAAASMKEYIGMDLFGFEETPQGTFLTKMTAAAGSISTPSPRATAATQWPAYWKVSAAAITSSSWAERLSARDSGSRAAPGASGSTSRRTATTFQEN